VVQAPKEVQDSATVAKLRLEVKQIRTTLESEKKMFKI
jgi:hypothetical protein